MCVCVRTYVCVCVYVRTYVCVYVCDDMGVLIFERFSSSATVCLKSGQVLWSAFIKDRGRG